MIRVGVGGWTFEPWRDNFYPAGLPQKRELEYASSKLTSIEINGTYYGSQKPESFRKWAEETPDDFVFALKGPRFATNRRILAEAGDSISRFFASGVTELGAKLGPINWQFMATKKFDADDFAGFLELLPRTVEGITIRHAVEVRHPSFQTPEFIALARKHGVAVVVAESDTFPQITDPAADFVYARLQQTREDEPAGYSAQALAEWAGRARTWAEGSVPADLPLLAETPAKQPRDVFIYMIAGFKPKAPAAAMALLKELAG
ncbi:MAG: DUF72 domain-containing protein [Candidatus Kaistia colombiensis]|nr:MAG: DUF72 domain-containing protein [Kaistia sp.]